MYDGRPRPSRYLMQPMPIIRREEFSTDEDVHRTSIPEPKMNYPLPANPSRRQLFGGFRPRKKAMMGQGSESFQPSEPMTASPGLSLDDLPPVFQATLAESQVRDLCRDLATEAADVRLSCNGLSAADATQLLAQAAESFLTNEIKRLQIRYTWQNKFWIDTLDKTAEEIRLVRIAHTKVV